MRSTVLFPPSSYFEFFRHIFTVGLVCGNGRLTQKFFHRQTYFQYHLWFQCRLYRSKVTTLTMDIYEPDSDTVAVRPAHRLGARWKFMAE